MLYYLFKYLDELDFPGAGMFHYITFRSACAIILSLLLATIIGKRVIRICRSSKSVKRSGIWAWRGRCRKKERRRWGGLLSCCRY